MKKLKLNTTKEQYWSNVELILNLGHTYNISANLWYYLEAISQDSQLYLPPTVYI